MQISLEKLKMFYHVIESGSLSKATHILGVKIAAVSLGLTHLEQELGVMLLWRNKKDIKLTPQGEVLYKLLQSTIPKLETIPELIGTELKQIKIATWHGLGTYWLSSHIAKYQTLNPFVKIGVFGDNVSRNFADYNCDVAILPKFEDSKDLIQTKIFSTVFKAYASKVYLEQHGTPLNFKDLAHHKLIGTGTQIQNGISFADWHIFDHLENESPRQTTYTINSSAGAAYFAQNNMGIVTLPEYFKDRYAKELIEIFPGYSPAPLDFYYIYPKAVEFSKRIKDLEDFLFSQNHESNHQ